MGAVWLVFLLQLTTTLVVFNSCNAQLTATPNLVIRQRFGTYGETISLKFNASVEYVVVYPQTNSIYPFTVKAWSNTASVKFPMMVVVRQEREVLSWQVPFIVDTSKKGESLKFMNTSRTLCHNNMDEINKSAKKGRFSKVPYSQLEQHFIVTLSTSSPAESEISIVVEEEHEFYVMENVRNQIAVSPSETRYVYYRFPDNKTDTVLVEVDSDDDVCLTVSVQDSWCPVFDLDKDITYEGKYQTVNKKGALIIRRREFPDGFFLIFVAKADNYECSQENSVLPMPRSQYIVLANRTSVLDFRITKGINSGDYARASLITLGAIGIFYVFCLCMICGFTRWGSMSRIRKISHLDACDSPVDIRDPPDDHQIHSLLTSKTLPVNMLAKYPETDKRRSFNYLWHILSIALFYSIPVVQLVITYQRVVNQTGNQDMCYYNFLCAHPAFGLSDYNHVYSNIGYIFIGILFLMVSLHRHAIVKDRAGVGIPVHYGLFYAMGIALIIEGLLSACYHICPSQSNYQFDTSFMYVMAVLCMIKLYQNRHPDVNATAYATFTVLGIAIFLAMVGILNGSLTVWIIFAIVYSILSIYISFKIYFFSYILEGVKSFYDEFKTTRFQRDLFKPVRTTRFILLFIANLVNYAMLITGLCLYDTGVTDFGTFLLGLLMGNAVLHTIFYTCMKLVHGERICVEAICYGLLMIASWAGSSIFFLDYATLWTVTPAESRQHNQDCILMDFYDTHDVWHLMSAPALYFSFMYLLCLDDDLIDTRQEDIKVF